MLNIYLQQTQRLIGDTEQQRVPPNDLKFYINTARRQVAELTQSVRVLTPISGSITSITVTNPGQGYSSSPSVTISPPDMPGGSVTNPGGLQATAIAHVTSGTITSITMVSQGAGYFQPTVRITDSTGSDAIGTAVLSPINQTVENQEVYSFANMPLGNAPGVASILAVKSVSMIYENYRYSLPMYAFSTYQAYIRRYPSQYSYVPTVGSQYGQGENGSLYLYPIASQAYAYECDCFCLPIDLDSDTDVEAIPYPWTDSVPYFAAYLALLQMQRASDADAMLGRFDKQLLRQSMSARPGRASNPYGRY